MGCKAFTPHLASLAKELQGERFHLIASHNQVGGAAAALHEAFQNGFDVFADNVSMTKFSDHPGVEGTGYVPYYMVFDEFGKLAYHHQGGPFHGGDGTAVLDRIRRMVRQLPPVILEPKLATGQNPIAKQLGSEKSLSSGARALAKALQASPGDAQLLELERALERHIASRVRAASLLMADDYQKGLKRLTSLQGQLARTPWTEHLDQTIEHWHALRGRIQESNKALRRVRRQWSQLKPVEGNGRPVLNPRDPGFRSRNQTQLDGLRGDLEAITQSFGGLPAADRAGSLLRVLGS